MNLLRVKEILRAQVICGEEYLDKEVYLVGATDLMSDALCLLEGGALLLTGLVSVQVVRTAELLDLVGVVFVRGKVPSNDIIELAKKANIPLLSTKYPMYEACGRLYMAGFKGKKVEVDS
ncbi:MAG: DRTGG domain-containing protein [Dictyoglomus sp.]